MKDYFNLRKSKLLLFALLTAFAGGVSPAWADAYTCGFEASEVTTQYDSGAQANIVTDITGWSNIGGFGSLKKYGEYKSGNQSVCWSAGNTSCYLVTPAVSGTIKFWVRNSSSSSSSKGSYSVYECTKGSDNSFTLSSSTAIASATDLSNTWTEVEITDYESVTEAKYLAILLNRAAIDDFSATNDGVGTLPKAKNLNATDITDEEAVLSWTSTATTWNLQYKAEGDTDYTPINNITTNPYTLTGLDAGTNYTFQVQAVFSEGQSAWSDAKDFTTLICSSSNQKNISYTLTDSYGDGWNGNTINVFDDATGNLIAALTLSSGASLEGTVALCPNRTYNFVWKKGSYPSETSFTLKDIDGNEIYTCSNGSDLTDGNTFATYSWDNTPVGDGAQFAINTNGTTTQDFGIAALNTESLPKEYTITNNGNQDLVVNVTNATDFFVKKTIRFSNNKGWSDVYLYAWDESGDHLTAAFPGDKQTNIVGKNEYNQDVYAIEIPVGTTKIIINKGFGGNENQSANIDMDYTKLGLYLKDDYTGEFFDDGYLSVPAGGSTGIKVVMKSATAGTKQDQNIELSFTAVNTTSPFTIPVSGIVLPEGAEVVDFNSTIPTRWENSGWTIENGAAKSTSNNVLTTQKLDFSGETSPFFIIKVKSTSTSSSGDQITIEGSTDNGQTWTAFDAIVKSYNNGDFGTSATDYSAIVISIPNTVNKLRFTGKYVLIDEITGLKYADEDPILAVTSDSEGNTEIATGTACDLGWMTADATATYYIKNKGTGTLNITEITAPAGITVTTAENVTTVTAGNTLAMTVTMAAANNLGVHSGTIAIATDGGNFEIPVSGVVIEDGKLYFDFSADGATFPTGWTTGNWNITGGTAVASGTLQTTTLTAAAGEQMVIEAISTGSFYSTASLSYAYSTDNGENWTSATITDQLSTSAYKIISLGVIDINNDADVLVKFTGSNVSVRRIYGFTAVAVAVMETTAANIAFGMQIAESAEQTFTISNTGEAELTGLSLTLGKTGEDAEYAIRMTNSDDSEFTGNTLAAGATINVIVKQLYDAEKLGDKSDVLTIAADGQTTKTINLTGATRDGSKLYVDFADNSWPEGWQHGSWSVSYGEATSSTDYTSIVTTPLTVTTGDKLSFDVKRSNSSASGRDLIVRYTTDGGVTWTAYDWSNYDWSATETLKDQITGSYNTFEITGIPAGTVAFEFSGKYVKLDNIKAGFALTSAPLVSFATVSDNISDANLKADGTATYTLANKGNADYVGTVAATNVTVDVTGDDVTFESNTLTIPVGKTATITVTMAFASPYGDKTGKLEITSESWVGDITADYNATLVDPTDFVEDFANGKPAGWYNGGWTISGGDAHVYTGTAKELITEKLGVESGKNVLSFDAKVYTGSDNQTLNVYTSTDRKTWSVAYAFTLTSDVQSFSFTALAADSYVKFEASNASIDNLTGVKKLDAPAHDLYQIGEATQPATGVPGASCTASMTAVSLRADETMIAELWLKKGEYYHKVASLENEAMTVDVNKTFTLTGNLPAEEGEYKMWITIKNSDNSAYINTDETDFTIAHTRTMDITNFENAPAAQANDNNEFEGTFTVTVQNTGSKSLAADEVSVTLIDNDDAESTFTKTLADVLFIETSNGTEDIAIDAKLGVWMWGASSGEWAEFTKVRDGFWCVDLKGNTGYIIVRQDPAKDFSLDDYYNKTDDIAFADGNLRSFSSYNGANMIFNAGTFALTNNQTIPVKVTVSGTLTDGEDASFNFKAKENVSNTFYGSGLTRSVNITAAPVIELDEAVGTIASTGANRKVTLNRTFVKGWNTICLPFAVTDLSVFGQGTTAYEFSEYAGGEIKFTAVSELAAGTPYLMNVPAAKTDAISFTDVTVISEAPAITKGDITFQGTYAGIAAADMDASKYSVTTMGNLKAGDENHALKGFRAYFTGITSAARLSIVEGEGQGIAGVVADGVLNTEVYNLNGQRVETLKKGQLYIINGKKQVVK